MTKSEVWLLSAPQIFYVVSAINKPLSVKPQFSASHLLLTSSSYKLHFQFILVFLFLVTKKPIQIRERRERTSFSSQHCIHIPSFVCWTCLWTNDVVKCGSCFFSLPDFASHHSYRWKIKVWVLLSLTPFPSTCTTSTDNGHPLIYSSETGNKCASFLVHWITLCIKWKVWRYAKIRSNKAGCHVNRLFFWKNKHARVAPSWLLHIKATIYHSGHVRLF